MTNYLIRHIKDSTGHTFTEVIKPRENECYELVSADSKEDAKCKYKEKNLNEGFTKNKSTVVSFNRPSEEAMESLFGKDYKKGV